MGLGFRSGLGSVVPAGVNPISKFTNPQQATNSLQNFRFGTPMFNFRGGAGSFLPNGVNGLFAQPGINPVNQKMNGGLMPTPNIQPLSVFQQQAIPKSPLGSLLSGLMANNPTNMG